MTSAPSDFPASFGHLKRGFDVGIPGPDVMNNFIGRGCTLLL